jgi:long-chain acyl-CoA synthetase
MSILVLAAPASMKHGAIGSPVGDLLRRFKVADNRESLHMSPGSPGMLLFWGGMENGGNDMNVAQLGEDHFERIGEAVTTIFEGREITNVETRENAGRLCNALKGLGVGADDVVAISMSNCPQVFESFAAVYAMGGIVLPILFVLSEEECRFILEDSGTVAIITDAILAPKMLNAAEGIESVGHIIVVGGEDSERTLSFEKLIGDYPAEREIVDREPDDVAILMYTSGTTGKPKGVMLTHENLITGAKSAYYAHELSGPVIGLMCLPMAHIYGVGALNSSAYSEFPESKSIVMRWFDPEECMRLIEKYKVDFFPAVPTMFSLILNHPNVDNYDLTSLEDCIAGAAPLPLELRRAFMDKFGCGMRQIYGLTEAAGMGTVVRPSQEWRDGAVGKPYDNMELGIFDDDDKELPQGTIGEVVIRGPQVMKGYHKLPRETEEALRGGWLHTGDVGFLDEDGYLHLTDRKKDIIIKGGENIMPTQIEEKIYEHPAVAEAAVIGILDSTYGEDIVAYVALKPGEEATSQELLSFCKENLPSFKCPREVRILDTLPKSSIGKILKRELRAQY